MHIYMYIYMYIYTNTKFDLLSLASHFILLYFILFYANQIISTIYTALFLVRLALSVVSLLILFYVCYFIVWGFPFLYMQAALLAVRLAIFVVSFNSFSFCLILLFNYLIVCFSFFLSLGGLTPSWPRSFCRLPRLSMMAGRQPVAAYCSVINCLQCVAVCRSVSQFVAVCCSVLQCVAVFCPFMMAGES